MQCPHVAQSRAKSFWRHAKADSSKRGAALRSVAETAGLWTALSRIKVPKQGSLYFPIKLHRKELPPKKGNQNQATLLNHSHGFAGVSTSAALTSVFSVAPYRTQKSQVPLLGHGARGKPLRSGWEDTLRNNQSFCLIRGQHLFFFIGFQTGVHEWCFWTVTFLGLDRSSG